MEKDAKEWANLQALWVDTIENGKLLLVVPIGVGMLAFGIASVLPGTYTSQALLGLSESDNPKAIESVIRSATVLDPVLQKYPSPLGVTDAGREELSKNVRFSVGGASPRGMASVAKLEVDSGTPELARETADALINAWLETTKPKPVSRQELERQLRLNQDALADVTRIVNRLTGETTKLVMPNLQYDLAQPLAQLLSVKKGYQDAIARIELGLRGATRDVVVSAPTLPTQPKRKPSMVGLMAAIASLGVMLAWIVLRKNGLNSRADG